MFIRRATTASDAIAVQIVRRENRRDVVMEHLGSTHTDADVAALVQAGRCHTRSPAQTTIYGHVEQSFRMSRPTYATGGCSTTGAVDRGPSRSCRNARRRALPAAAHRGQHQEAHPDPAPALGHHTHSGRPDHRRPAADPRRRPRTHRPSSPLNLCQSGTVICSLADPARAWKRRTHRLKALLCDGQGRCPEGATCTGLF